MANAVAGNRMPGRGWRPGDLTSPELVGDQASSASMASRSRARRWSRMRTSGVPDAGGQHHHAHDAFGVDAALAALIQTSQGKLPASLVSLAEARACRPSIADGRGGFDHGRRRAWFCGAVMATCITPWCHRHRARGQRVQRLVAIAHAAQEHGQVGAGDQFGPDAVHQLLRHVAGGVAPKISVSTSTRFDACRRCRSLRQRCGRHPSVSSGAHWAGRPARHGAAQSGNTCKAHWRSAWASGHGR